jgi:hypothetical protein
MRKCIFVLKNPVKLYGGKDLFYRARKLPIAEFSGRSRVEPGITPDSVRGTAHNFFSVPLKTRPENE